jgi:hypothetical protein
MKAVFIESTEFTQWVSAHLPDDAYAALQQELLDDPLKGRVMPGCGGLRKIRTPDPRRGKGKRGGARVIYLYVPEAKCFFMLDVYDKDEQEKLSSSEKKTLAALATEFKRQARSEITRDSRRKK